MPWSSLSTRIEDVKMPYVLAGPILRKTTPTEVTVWLAMRKSGSVELTVLNEHETKVMAGSRRAVAIGKHLHIVAVTAKLRDGAPPLEEGSVYQYNLDFEFDGFPVRMSLAASTNSAKLAYAPYQLPSFVLPPKDPNFLRLIQGSCRLPHAPGVDMLPYVSDLIETSAANAYARPHQLLLTGDQIYADDVSSIMLLMLSDAANTLLGWQEKFSGLPFENRDLTAPEIPPYLRSGILKYVDIGITSVDLGAHLFSLGEYLSMYLFVWSDVLWPDAAALPSFDNVVDVVGKFISSLPEKERRSRMKGLLEKRETVGIHIDSLKAFRSKLHKVRLALANIPCYMIFDDHEVTDDWNMTRDHCNKMYAGGLGQDIARNAVAAYAVCQHWGNAPDQFISTPVTPGGSLLVQLDTPNPTAANAFDTKAASMQGAASMIMGLVGLHSEIDLRGKPGLFHDPFSLKYHYTIEGPGHQVIVVDTRTWRSFPYGDSEGGELLPKAQFKSQIVDTFDTGDRVLIVVLSTNAPPTEPIRAATRHAGLTTRVRDFPDIYEAWEIASAPFDRLIKAITDKLPLNSDQHRFGQAILLSGDVHHSFASRLSYRASNRFEDATPQPATAVIAQLVASGFKSEADDTYGYHRQGYLYAPTKAKAFQVAIAYLQFRPHKPETYPGWNAAVGIVGSRNTELNEGTLESPIRINAPGTLDLYDQLKHPLDFVRITAAPDYRYRFDYLLPTFQQVQLNIPPILPMSTATSPAQRKQAAAAWKSVATVKRAYNLHSSPKVVGLNNFSEITFIWPNGHEKQVNHRVHWWDKQQSKLALTTYQVSLNPNDPYFPDRPLSI